MAESTYQFTFFDWCSIGDLKEVQNGLQACPELATATDCWKRSPLHAAAERGNTDVCRLLVDKGASLDLQSDRKRSPLHAAALMGHLDVCRLLVDKGACLDLQDHSEQSPLHLAAMLGHSSICHFLVDQGANLDLQDHMRYSPLHVAAKKGRSDVCRFLLDKGASLDLQDKLEQSPLHIAAEEGHFDVCCLLVGEGANIDLQHHMKMSPLHIAAEKGYFGICHLLVDRGASLDLQDKVEQSPLHIAAEEGHLDVCRLLVGEGANVDLRRRKMKMSPLHIAAENGHSDICRVLVDKGASLDLQDERKRSPLYIAALEGQADVCHILVDKGSCIVRQGEQSPFHIAAEKGHLDVCRIFVEKGDSLDIQGYWGWSPLHFAAGNGHAGVCRLLVQNGASINLQDEDGNTPLHLAARYSKEAITSVEMCRLLMSHKADPMIKNKHGSTASWVAVTGSCQRMLQTYEAEFEVAHLPKEKPKTVRLAVVGDEAVGKTQFIETVTSSAVAARVRSLRAPPKPGTAAYLAQRTPGIAIKKIALRHQRKLRVLDFGGQLQFIAGHRPILVTKFGIYLVIVKLELDLDTMITSAFFWLAFIVATRDPATISGLRPPPIFIAFSHADCMASMTEALKLSRQVYSLLREKYGKYFTWMDGNPYVCNCRVRSNEMERLLEGLSVAHTLVVEEMPGEPLLNTQIRKALKKHRQSFQSSIMTLKDYSAFVLEHAFRLWKPNAKELVALTTLLDEQVDVMMFDCKAEQADQQGDSETYVVVDPHDMCRNMLKAILSPHKFPGSHLVFPKHGVIGESVLDEALSQAGVDPSAGKALLEHSKVSTPVIAKPDASCQESSTPALSPDQGPRSHFFAIHVQHTSMPDNAWVEDGKTKPQAGVQLHCPSIIPVSPAYLPAVQVDLSKHTGGITEDSLIWKSGMIIQEEKNVSVLVQRANDSLNVNFIARAEPNHLEDCATALGKVVRTASKTADSITPGSEVQPRYLSPSQLGAFKSPDAVVAYRSGKVIRCYNEERNLQQGVVLDDPKDIIAVVKAVEPCRCSEIADMTGEAAARVAAEIGDRMTCIGLALEIGVDRGPLADIEGKSGAHYTSRDCRSLLMDWWKAQPDSAGAILYQSLVSIGRKDIAERHKEALQVTGAGGAANISYGNWQHHLLMKRAVFGVAQQLGRRMDCIGLGKELAIHGGPLVQIEAKPDHEYLPGDAYDMLNTWLLSKPPEPRKALHTALVDVGKRTIADDFDQFLLTATAAD